MDSFWYQQPLPVTTLLEEIAADYNAVWMVELVRLFIAVVGQSTLFLVADLPYFLCIWVLVVMFRAAYVERILKEKIAEGVRLAMKRADEQLSITQQHYDELVELVDALKLQIERRSQ